MSNKHVCRNCSQLGRKTPQGRGVSSTWSCRTSKVALCRDGCLVEYYTRHSLYNGVDAVTDDLGYRVVMKLMENYLHQNRHVYADNYFTSVSLAKDLLAEDTYLCGTSWHWQKLKPGESIKWTNDDSVMLVKWRDRRDVYVIATDDEGLHVVR